MIPIVYILINLLQAIWHWYRIEKKNELITSKRKILEYFIASTLVGLTIFIFLEGKLVPLILFCFLSRLAFFDGFLNILRGKSVLYEGEINKRKSLYDWFEAQTGLPIAVLRMFYLMAFLIYLIIWMRQ